MLSAGRLVRGSGSRPARSAAGEKTAALAPWRTCCKARARWAATGVVGQIRDHLQTRPPDLGRAPGAGLHAIGSQSVKTGETAAEGLARLRRCQKISTAAQRHLVVDKKGLPLLAMATPADLTAATPPGKSSSACASCAPRSDRMGRLRLRRTARHLGGEVPEPDSEDGGPAQRRGRVRRPARHRVVERPHAWAMHTRRHARGCERLVQRSESLTTRAPITLMTRRITRRQSRRARQRAGPVADTPATDEFPPPTPPGSPRLPALAQRAPAGAVHPPPRQNGERPRGPDTFPTPGKACHVQTRIVRPSLPARRQCSTRGRSGAWPRGRQGLPG